MAKIRPRGAKGPASAPDDGMAPFRALAAAHSDDFISALLSVDAAARAAHVRLLRMIVVLAFLLPASVIANEYQATRPPAIRGVATMTSGINSPLPLMPTPINTEAEVRDWVTGAVVQAYTLNFADYNKQLSGSYVNFTPDGFEGFRDAIKNSGVLKAVREQKFRVSAVPSGPTVMKTLEPDKLTRKMWVFEVPIVVTYEGPSVKPSTNLLVSVTVVPQPVWQQERGLGIASMTLEGGLGG